MNEESCVRETSDEDSTSEVSNEYQSVKIQKASNGFIIRVGCQTFVAKTWKEASDGLAEYWYDPQKAERKFTNHSQ